MIGCKPMARYNRVTQRNPMTRCDPTRGGR